MSGRIPDEFQEEERKKYHNDDKMQIGYWYTSYLTKSPARRA
jgi:hypothetical protein